MPECNARSPRGGPLLFSARKLSRSESEFRGAAAKETSRYANETSHLSIGDGTGRRQNLAGLRPLTMGHSITEFVNCRKILQSDAGERDGSVRKNTVPLSHAPLSGRIPALIFPVAFPYFSLSSVMLCNRARLQCLRKNDRTKSSAFP